MPNRNVTILLAGLIAVTVAGFLFATTPGSNIIRRVVPGGDTGSGNTKPQSPGIIPSLPVAPGGSGGNSPGPIIELDPKICLPPLVKVGC